MDAPLSPTKPSAGSAHVVWVSCGGCDGCTMSALGATSPRLEELLSGQLTHFPSVSLIHPALNLESGERYLDQLRAALRSELDPFILVVEGSLFDQALAGSGTFSGLGDEDGQPIPVERWVQDLASAATAVIAIGTCATWGGIPAARGNVTGAMSLTDLLGGDFRSRADLPVINVPGCAPNGDAFIETITYALLHLGGLVPLDLDDLNRPRWLYARPVPLQGADLEWTERADPA
ncbi:MAG: hydrogenase expression protein HypE, partial [Actinomycetota bacterium]